MDKVRVLRVLEYEGDREWVEMCLKQSSVPNNGERAIRKSKYGEYDNVIRSAIVGTFPAIFDDAKHTIGNNDSEASQECPSCGSMELERRLDKRLYCFRCGQKIEL